MPLPDQSNITFVPDPAETDARLRRVAAALGVKPITRPGAWHVVLATADHEEYDWLELVEAHLIAMEKAAS